MSLVLDERYLAGVLGERDWSAAEAELADAFRRLRDRTGRGNEFLGWLDLPERVGEAELARLEEAGERIRQDSDVVVLVGIGGSYLGARAVLEAVKGFWGTEADRPRLVYAGHHLSSDYHAGLLRFLDGKEVSVIVVSKSGTTTEPAVAFRLLSRWMERRYGKGASARIHAVTDARRGALRKMAEERGYPTWVIPDDVGGRFSVLTPVGLLPLAAAGVDIRRLVGGARRCMEESAADASLGLALNRYAVARNLLYRKGKKTEILATFEPSFHYVAEWWKQLFGESEGKEGKGIFPASVDFTTDLHSMGQWIQEAERTVFETFLVVDRPAAELRLEAEADDVDGLNYLAGKTMHEVNLKAWEGTAMAHADGGVPSMTVRIPAATEEHLGYLLYWFERACGLSGYMLGVNPFDQPGVEAYKRNMFRLLGKPGF